MRLLIPKLRKEGYAWLLLAIILTAGFVFRLIFLSEMNLFVDEAYYWDWSRHLSFGYFSHPPMVAWLIFLGRSIFGDTEFGVRIPFVIVGLATILTTYILAKTFLNKKTAFLLALFVSFSPGYVSVSRLATPDQLIVFFWILSMIFFWRAYKGERLIDWIFLGVFLGFGFLSKYQMIFLPLAVFIFLLAYPRGRGLLKTPYPYISLVISVLIFLPNILWNAGHSWITFIFQSVYGLERSFGSRSLSGAKVFNTITLFLKETIETPDIIFKLAIFLSLPIVLWFGIRRKREEFVFLFLSFILIVAFFSIFFGKSHWFFPGLIGAYLMLSYFLINLIENKYTAIAGLSLTILLFLLNISVSWELINTFAFADRLTPKFEKGRIYQMVFNSSHGWKEMVEKVARAIDYKEGKWVLLAQNYTIASELAFYLPGQLHIYSPNGQYLIWGSPKTEPENILTVAYSPKFLDSAFSNVNSIEISQGPYKLYLAQRSGAEWEKLDLDWSLKLEGP